MKIDSSFPNSLDPPERQEWTRIKSGKDERDPCKRRSDRRLVSHGIMLSDLSWDLSWILSGLSLSFFLFFIRHESVSADEEKDQERLDKPGHENPSLAENISFYVFFTFLNEFSANVEA